MTGFVLDKEHPSVIQKMQGYELEISLDQIFLYQPQHGYGLLISTGSHTFVGPGYGFRVIFRSNTTSSTRIGIATVEEGTYQNGEWVPGRRFNGDETEGGLAWRFLDAGLSTGISHCTVYHYE